MPEPAEGQPVHQDEASTSASQHESTTPEQSPHGEELSPARSAIWGWMRLVLSLLALPVATWVLVRGLLAPVAGPEGVDNAVFGSVWGLLLVIVLPLAVGFAMRSHAERRGLAQPAGFRAELRLALYGLAWLAVFALLATATLAFFWRPSADDFVPVYPLVAAFWLGWGALWGGLWLGLRWLGLPASGGQLLVGAGGIAWSTALLWLNPWLERISDPGVKLDAMGVLVWTSPMYGWVSLVLDLDLFRTGAMYHGSDGQGAYSIIGDYFGSIPHWPSLAEMLLTWALLAVGVMILGAGVRSLRTRVQRLAPSVAQQQARAEAPS